MEQPDPGFALLFAWVDRTSELDCRSSQVDQELDAPLQLADLGEEPDVRWREGRAHFVKDLTDARGFVNFFDNGQRFCPDVADVDVVSIDQMAQNDKSRFRRQAGVEIANPANFPGK